VTVVVITYRRPEYVKNCLAHLSRQTDPADEVIVVDASEDTQTAVIVAGVPGVQYIHSASGAGAMTRSRNVALGVASGDVVAFLDDDAYVDAEYLRRLRDAYQDPTVHLACSRTLSGTRGEETIGAGSVGKLLPSGELTGNFAFAAESTLDIDHGVGATMSFRRSALATLGGFCENYGGTAVREETDAFLRARRLGLRAVFISDAVARHVAAPQVRGHRFDLRYEYWGSRNHVVLLASNFGLKAPIVRRYLAGHVMWPLRSRDRSAQGRVARTLVVAAGLAAGIVTSLRTYGLQAGPAALTGVGADRVREALRSDSADA
jgi:GT2 family glycosyltransferase